MKQVTAVEWLFMTMNIRGLLPNEEIIECYEQAKEMEKQQMWDYIESNYVNGENSLAFHKEEFEQYYNETYKNK